MAWISSGRPFLAGTMSGRRSEEAHRETVGRRHRPVMVLPGLGGGDWSTAVLRSQLSVLGHPVHGWGLGRNVGLSPEVLAEVTARVDALVERHERPVALVGWSLGGLLASIVAADRPASVAVVVALGSPLRSPRLPALPPVPVTSIWSRHDRIVNWTVSRLDDGPYRENIEVRATHLTLGFDPFVISAVADRVAQPRRGWRPFRPRPWMRAGFPST